MHYYFDKILLFAKIGCYIRFATIRQGDRVSYEVLPCLVMMSLVVVPFQEMRSPRAWIFDGGLTV
jgi:hypothetical protein